LTAPAVTFIVTCYNYGRFLPDALNSLLRQSRKDLELIVIDDASSDETPQVLEGYRSDSRVRIIRHERNAGNIASYNEGLARASGRYVAILSADDYILVDHAVESQVRKFEADERVGLVYSAHTVVQASAPPWNVVPWADDRIHSGIDEFRKLIWGNYILHSGAMLRTDVARELGPYDPALPHSGDWDMWLRASARHWVGYVAEPLYAYRIHGTNMFQRAMPPQYETDQVLLTIKRAYASLAPHTPADLLAARTRALRHGLLQTPWFDLHTGHRRRTWRGLLYALRRRPDLLWDSELWRFLARLLVMTLAGRDAYRRLDSRLEARRIQASA
jgi:glycosyltransferase involved in cell wall biosynthesis